MPVGVGYGMAKLGRRSPTIINAAWGGVFMWDGRLASMYHYVASDDFPYTIGCIKGQFDYKLIEILSGPRPWF